MGGIPTFSAKRSANTARDMYAACARSATVHRRDASRWIPRSARIEQPGNQPLFLFSGRYRTDAKGLDHQYFDEALENQIATRVVRAGLLDDQLDDATHTRCPGLVTSNVHRRRQELDEEPRIGAIKLEIPTEHFASSPARSGHHGELRAQIRARPASASCRDPTRA